MLVDGKSEVLFVKHVWRPGTGSERQRRVEGRLKDRVSRRCVSLSACVSVCVSLFAADAGMYRIAGVVAEMCKRTERKRRERERGTTARTETVKMRLLLLLLFVLKTLVLSVNDDDGQLLCSLDPPNQRWACMQHMCL